MNGITDGKQGFYAIVYLVTTIIMVALAAGPVYAADPSADDALVIVNAGQNPDDVQAAIIAAGGKITHVFPPDAFIATLSGGSLDGATVYFSAVDMLVAANLSDNARRAAAVWNTLQAPAATLNIQISADNVEENPNDALIAPEPDGAEQLARAGSSSPRPAFEETSQFMIGSVAVGIILPESNGITDASTENWTEAQRTRIVGEIVNALNWWAEREPAAQLSFVYDDVAAKIAPTAVEPISRPYYDQSYWIADTMNAMGFTSASGSYFEQVRLYNNHLRDTYHTDWAFTIFVVNSDNDADNRFSDRFFAYAYLGGPFMVMTSGNNGYGPENMDAVAAHETGHIFQALDQYSSANQSCTAVAGYLGVQNQNSQLGCALDQPSIMRGQISPYTNKNIDPYAAGQLGWQDANHNSILDPVDVTADVTNVTWAEGSLSNIITFNGSLAQTPLTSPLYRSILINKFQQVQYRVDSGPWQIVTAADGAFDSHAEDFTFTTDPLPGGEHTIHLKATDNFGKITEQEIAVISVVDPTGGYIDTAFEAPYSRQMALNAAAVELLSGVAYQLNGGMVARVEYRLDGGAWQTVPAADGAFNSDTEDFTISVNGSNLESGTHIVEARAVDNGGFVDSTPAVMTITVQPSGQSLHTVFLPVVVH